MSEGQRRRAEATAPDWVDTSAPSAEEHPEALWRAHSDAVNIAWLGPRLPPEPVARVLKTDLFDEALAAGLYPSLAARSLSVIGIDIAASTLGVARARYAQLDGARADARRLPFATQVFDCVVSNSTLDHFASRAEIAASLAELHRVLRPGGQLLLTLDNLANPVVAVRNALPLRPLAAIGIVPHPIGVSCGPRSLQRLVRQAGLEVLEVGAIMHCPRVLAVAAARLVQRHGSPPARQRLLRFLMRFEPLSGWPTRFLTGHFITVVARRR